MAPVAPWMTFNFTSSVLNLIKESTKASKDPCTSALTIIFSSFILPSLILSKRLSSLMESCLITVSSRVLVFLCSLMSLAFFSSGITIKSSPALGTPEIPYISTGMDGRADFIFCPLSSNIALTLPKLSPQTKKSPWLRVPLRIRIVAIGPLFLSSLASITVPLGLFL